MRLKAHLTSSIFPSMCKSEGLTKTSYYNIMQANSCIALPDIEDPVSDTAFVWAYLCLSMALTCAFRRTSTSLEHWRVFPNPPSASNQ